MGLTKSTSFTAEQNRIAELAKAFAHPARVAIVQYLLKTNSCVCGDIVDALPLSQSTVSQHLKEMKKAGIITGSVEPPKVCYCINPTVWEEVKLVFNGLLAQYQKEGCC
ncbi:MAG: metalloregulator ArsR/SmtB family transcription factor [Bacteroidota bacterium]